ncbi:MAG: DUF624 domain-containing protein [Oscillospiraceae bacterium]|nr:DUF624 domain-containing protein [Oscillospiraceae bacterium]
MAGFFGFFDYSKPGKGVRKDEPKRSHFVMFFILLQRKFWKMVQVNILFLLFCLPVVGAVALTGTGTAPSLVLPLTILQLVVTGPAIAGMLYILRNIETESPVFLLSDFWDSFKGNFKQAFLYGLLCAAVTYLMYLAATFYMRSAPDNIWMYAPLGLVLFMSLMFLFANFYIFPMIVTLELPLPALIKNGVILSMICAKANFIILFWLVLIVFVFWLFPVLGFIFYLLIGCSVIGFVIMHNAYPGIKKYAIDPYMAQLEEDAAKPVEGGVFEDERTLPEDKS